MMGAQFIRYALVGLLSNGICYLFYLGATALGVAPKLAMSVLYVLATLQTFWANRSWTFGDVGRVNTAFARYAALYLLGYLLNLGLLSLGTDLFGWPHEWVMAGVIVCVAVFLFAGQRLWVFRQPLRKAQSA